MKTIKERSEILLDALDLYKKSPRHLLIEAVVSALKEQEQITRHACAENITMIKEMRIVDGEYFISKNKAHSVVMNTKAV